MLRKLLGTISLCLLALFAFPKASEASIWDIIWGMSGPQMMGLVLHCEWDLQHRSGDGAQLRHRVDFHLPARRLHRRRDHAHRQLFGITFLSNSHLRSLAVAVCGRSYTRRLDYGRGWLEFRRRPPLARPIGRKICGFAPAKRHERRQRRHRRKPGTA